MVEAGGWSELFVTGEIELMEVVFIEVGEDVALVGVSGEDELE